MDPKYLLDQYIPAPEARAGLARVRDLDRRQLRSIEHLLGRYPQNEIFLHGTSLNGFVIGDFRRLLRSLVSTMARRRVLRADRLSYRDLEQIIKRCEKKSHAPA